MSLRLLGVYGNVRVVVVGGVDGLVGWIGGAGGSTKSLHPKIVSTLPTKSNHKQPCD